MRFKFSVLSIWIGLLIFFVGNGGINLNAQQQGGDMEKAAETPKKKVDGLVVYWLNDFEAF